MNRLKRNQIVIYSIALMLVVAGYLNYIERDNSLEISANTQNTNNIGDATLVSNNEMEEGKKGQEDDNTQKNSSNSEQQAQETNSKEQNNVNTEKDNDLKDTEGNQKIEETSRCKSD